MAPAVHEYLTVAEVAALTRRSEFPVRAWSRRGVLPAVLGGEDAKDLPDKVRLGLRRQALDWLRDDLALYAKLADREEAAAKQFVRQQIAHWQQSADLTPVRDPEALGRLPDDERQQWRQLWGEVAALLKKLGEMKAGRMDPAGRPLTRHALEMARAGIISGAVGIVWFAALMLLRPWDR